MSSVNKDNLIQRMSIIQTNFDILKFSPKQKASFQGSGELHDFDFQKLRDDTYCLGLNFNISKYGYLTTFTYYAIVMCSYV